MESIAVAIIICCPIVCGTVLWLKRQERKASAESLDRIRKGRV